jgi:glycerol-3-phosphate dehydrogenase
LNFDYDVAVIGAGLLGCFVAKNLVRHKWRVAVFEKNSDVCTEMSKANTAIIYPGYDNKPGSLKARLAVSACKDFDRLCVDLGVRLRRSGSLMVAFGAQGEHTLGEKYNQGLQNGVEHLRLLDKSEILSIEPHISPTVTRALYAQDTATVNPWELCVAAYENAVENGACFYFESPVTSIRKIEDGYELAPGGQSFRVRAIVNCSGLHSAKVNELVNKPSFRLNLTVADYLLLDEEAGSYLRHIVMYEPEQKTERGVTLVPTVDGNLLIGSSKIKSNGKTDFSTTRKGCDELREASSSVFPGLPLDTVIRSFASIRPSIVMLNADGTDNNRRVPDLPIFEAENPGFINFAGVKTPGLTCCDKIGEYVTDMLLYKLGNPGANDGYQALRKAPTRFAGLSFSEQVSLSSKDPGYSQVVCRCRIITEAEIISAIRKTPGIASLDAVKKRAGTNMGRCQGSFCTERIIQLIAQETDVDIYDVRKSEAGSNLLRKI